MEKVINVTVGGEMSGRRIKDLLTYKLGLSGNNIKKLKFHGKILKNGENAAVRDELSVGDKITLVFPDERSESIVPSDIPIEVIYEDDDVLAVNKSSAMPTHPSAGHRDDTLANAVMYRYCGSFVFRPITRLDGDTTGTVLIAKNAASGSRLCADIAAGKLHKSYIALCVGVPKESSGTIDAPIGRADGSIIKHTIRADGAEAVTKYEVISQSQSGAYSLIRAYPITGRTHQIRIHLASIGCPIYGDFLYGEEIPGVRTLLHCESVTFPHPSDGHPVKVTSEIPPDMRKMTVKLNLA